MAWRPPPAQVFLGTSANEATHRGGHTATTTNYNSIPMSGGVALSVHSFPLWFVVHLLLGSSPWLFAPFSALGRIRSWRRLATAFVPGHPRLSLRISISGFIQQRNHNTTHIASHRHQSILRPVYIIPSDLGLLYSGGVLLKPTCLLILMFLFNFLNLILFFLVILECFVLFRQYIVTYSLFCGFLPMHLLLDSPNGGLSIVRSLQRF